jgi:hypothetical protein
MCVLYYCFSIIYMQAKLLDVCVLLLFASFYTSDIQAKLLVVP